MGTLPIDSMILPDQRLVFGGRYWKVIDINCERKTILVVPAKVGTPPKFGGAGMGIHDRIRQEMYAIYRSGDHGITIGDANLEFLDATGQRLFQEGLGYFRDTSLEFDCIVQHGNRVYIIPWMGDKLVSTLVAVLHYSGYKADAYAGIIEINNVTITDISEYLKSITSSPTLSNTELARSVKKQTTEKFDHLLSDQLLNVSYWSKIF